MTKINYYIANSTGKLDGLIKDIEMCVNEAKKILLEKLNADQIDIIFFNDLYVIKELGVGGTAINANAINIRIDPDFKDLQTKQIMLTIIHEGHHCMRWRKPGLGKTLGEVMISEGMATLFEAEIGGKTPIFGKVKITEDEINQANKHINDTDYNHARWFFGSKDIQKWFGYTYGYQLCKTYSTKTRKTASELVNIDASEILKDINY